MLDGWALSFVFEQATSDKLLELLSPHIRFELLDAWRCVIAQDGIERFVLVALLERSFARGKLKGEAAERPDVYLLSIILILCQFWGVKYYSTLQSVSLTSFIGQEN